MAIGQEKGANQQKPSQQKDPSNQAGLSLRPGAKQLHPYN
jgi:hypothetical protein